MTTFFQILVISVLFTIFLIPTDGATPEYRSHFCSSTTFSPNSTFQSNLNLLLSSLVSNATGEIGFYNATAGRGGLDAIFGSFLCRGDVDADTCRNCVATAATDGLRQYCPSGKMAILWYVECTLRYSDQNFFGEVDEAPRVILYNTGNISDHKRFVRLLGKVLNETVTAAVAGAKKFATGEAVFSELQTLYSLVQCTPDLSGFECNRCLRGAIALLPECCANTQGANVLYPSCNVRFEVYPFYSVATSPPSLTPPRLLRRLI